MDGSGQKRREETCFVDCRAFGRSAENINKYCQKGRPLLVEGRLTFDSWQAQDGSKRSRLRVTVERFQFVGASGGGAGPEKAAPGRESHEDVDSQAPAASDDDIPF